MDFYYLTFLIDAGISFDLGVDLLDGGYNGCEGTWLRMWCVWGMFEWLLFL